MANREALALLLPLLLVLAAPAGAGTKPALRDEIDRFTSASHSDYAACAQHIALEYQWSAFLHKTPGAAMMKCARDLRSKYDAEIGTLETALRHDKKAQAALRAYYADWRETVDGLKPGPQPALRANLDRLDGKAAAIKLRQAEAKPKLRYGGTPQPPAETEAAN